MKPRNEPAPIALTSRLLALIGTDCYTRGALMVEPKFEGYSERELSNALSELIDRRQIRIEEYRRSDGLYLQFLRLAECQGSVPAAAEATR